WSRRAVTRSTSSPCWRATKHRITGGTNLPASAVPVVPRAGRPVPRALPGLRPPSQQRRRPRGDDLGGLGGERDGPAGEDAQGEDGEVVQAAAEGGGLTVWEGPTSCLACHERPKEGDRRGARCPGGVPNSSSPGAAVAFE